MRVKVPTQWSDISIRKYIEFMNIHKKDMDRISRITNTVSAICNIPIEEVMKVSISSLAEVYKRTEWMMFPDREVKVIGGSQKGENSTGFIKVNGKEYECQLNVRDWDAGKYVDLMTYMKDPIENLDKIMARYFVPKGGKYGDVSTTDLANEFYEYMTMDTVNAYSLFFSKVYGNLIAGIQVSSLRQANQKTKELLEEMNIKTTSNIGDGLSV